MPPKPQPPEKELGNSRKHKPPDNNRQSPYTRPPKSTYKSPEKLKYDRLSFLKDENAQQKGPKTTRRIKPPQNIIEKQSKREAEEAALHSPENSSPPGRLNKNLSQQSMDLSSIGREETPQNEPKGSVKAIPGTGHTADKYIKVDGDTATIMSRSDSNQLTVTEKKTNHELPSSVPFSQNQNIAEGGPHDQLKGNLIDKYKDISDKGDTDTNKTNSDIKNNHVITGNDSKYGQPNPIRPHDRGLGPISDDEDQDDDDKMDDDDEEVKDNEMDEDSPYSTADEDENSEENDTEIPPRGNADSFKIIIQFDELDSAFLQDPIAINDAIFNAGIPHDEIKDLIVNNGRKILVLEAFNKESAERWLHIKEVAGSDVTCRWAKDAEHSSFGTIGPISCPIEKVEMERKKASYINLLKKRGTDVISVGWISKREKQGDTWTTIMTKTLKIEFPGPIPDKIYLGSMAYTVREYIPEVTQCFKCHKFGHVGKHCHNTLDTCVFCSVKGHRPRDRKCQTRRPRCSNCRGPHPASYRGCIAYKSEKEALRMKHQTRINIHDARKIVKEDNYPPLQGKTGQPQQPNPPRDRQHNDPDRDRNHGTYANAAAAAKAAADAAAASAAASAAAAIDADAAAPSTAAAVGAHPPPSPPPQKPRQIEGTRWGPGRTETPNRRRRHRFREDEEDSYNWDNTYHRTRDTQSNYTYEEERMKKLIVDTVTEMLPNIMMGFAAVLCKVLYGQDTNEPTEENLSDLLKGLRNKTKSDQQQENIRNVTEDPRPQMKRYLQPVGTLPGSSGRENPASLNQHQNKTNEDHNPEEETETWKNRS